MRKINTFGNAWRLVLKLFNGFKKLDLRFKDFNFHGDKLTKTMKCMSRALITHGLSLLHSIT